MTTDNTKRTAAQRLDDLEKGIMEAYRVLDNVVRDLMTIKDAIKLLGNKTNAIVQVSAKGDTLNDANLSAAMIENNVADLKSKVDGLVAQGVLKEEEQVGDASFVVAREKDAEGNVVNPRLQFALSALPEEMRAKIKGAKSGDILTLEENKLKLEVLETYEIQNPADAAPKAAPAFATEDRATIKDKDGNTLVSAPAGQDLNVSTTPTAESTTTTQ